MPQMIAQFPQMIAIMQSMRTMMLTMHSTMSGVFGQMDDSNANPTAMGKTFDAAQNDDSFYIPADVFKNADFKRVIDIFISPDGKAVRMLITQKGDPASSEGIARVDAIKNAAEEALKGTPLEGSKIYLTGTAAMTKDIVVGSRFDLMIAVVAAHLPYFHRHADHDEKFRCRPGYRRYGFGIAGRSVRSVCVRLAVHARHTDSLGSARDDSDRPLGGRI